MAKILLKSGAANRALCGQWVVNNPGKPSFSTARNDHEWHVRLSGWLGVTHVFRYAHVLDVPAGDAKLGSKLVVASCSCLTSWITVVLGAEPGQWPQDSCEPRAALAALFALQNGRSVEDDVGRG